MSELAWELKNPPQGIPASLSSYFADWMVIIGTQEVCASGSSQTDRTARWNRSAMVQDPRQAASLDATSCVLFGLESPTCCHINTSHSLIPLVNNVQELPCLMPANALGTEEQCVLEAITISVMNFGCCHRPFKCLCHPCATCCLTMFVDCVNSSPEVEFHVYTAVPR